MNCLIIINNNRSMDEALFSMHANHVRYVLVREDDKFIGMISLKDIITYCIRIFSQ